MFQKIIDWWDNRKRMNFILKYLESPLGISVTAYIKNDILENNKTYLGKHLSEENKILLFNQIMIEICAIAYSKDPLMECRKYILEHVYGYACLGVPVIYPPPKKDFSGYRGLPGITGEIFGHISELIIIDENLKKYIWSCDVPNDIKNNPDFQYELFLGKSSEAQLHINAANILRIYLNDYKDEPERDWLRKCIEIEFALCESRYRDLLGLDDVLEIESPLKYGAHIFYPIFREFILSGKEFPMFEWENMLTERIS